MVDIFMKKGFRNFIGSSLAIGIGFISVACGQDNTEKKEMEGKKEMGSETVILAAGCFWCVEEIYEHVPGVSEAVSGYSGGKEENPTYKDVSAGKTGHTEAVEVMYDSKKVSLDELLDIFWKSFDPTNGKGVSPDFGTQYRPALFYKTEEEKKIMEASKAAIAKKLGKKVEVEIVPFEKFWIAEEYHQDFAKRNPNQGYVKAVSIPRMKRTLGKE